MGLHSVGLDAGLDGSYAPGSYGVLGGPGVASGGFFVSPLADDDEPDVQVTIFPRVTEPHVITQVQNSTAHLPSMLVTVALLRPEGRQRVTVGLGGRMNPEAGTTDFFGGVEVKREQVPRRTLVCPTQDQRSRHRARLARGASNH